MTHTTLSKITQILFRAPASVAAWAALCATGQVNAGQLPGVEEAWVAQYNGSFSYWEEVTDLALSEDGVYVTGFEYTDYVTRAFATVKYDNAGRKLWSRNYGLGGVNGSAQANAVVVDSSGNVFVTGWSYEYVPGPPETIICDAATLKYDPNGNLLWEHRYRLPGINNQPQDIVIDSAGNAYVAGAAWVGDAAGGFDLMLLKYSPDGVLLWDRTIGKAGDRWDVGYAVALDPNENPVVAGYTEPSLFDDITFGYLVKYSASGNLQWQREHISYTNASTWWHVVINAAGQIYAFGEIAPLGDLYHVWTSQYSANGTLLWDRHYDGSASDANYAGDIALTPSGGVVVCGTSWDFGAQGGFTQIVTLRYEPDGTQMWQQLERGGYAHALGQDVAVDGLGRAYVTGYGFNENGFEDMVTLSYSPDGDLTWTQIYADPNGHSDRSAAIAVDEAFNVIVAGDAWVGFENYYDFTTIRYTIEVCPPDINGSGAVNVIDLLAVINGWGACSGCAPDINSDGQINVVDMLAVINAWGACP
jgi:hypothetical protein